MATSVEISKEMISRDTTECGLSLVSFDHVIDPHFVTKQFVYSNPNPSPQLHWDKPA